MLKKVKVNFGGDIIADFYNTNGEDIIQVNI